LEIDLAALARQVSNVDAERARENADGTDAVAKVVGGTVVATDALGLAPARALANTVAAAAIALADAKQAQNDKQSSQPLRMVMNGDGVVQDEAASSNGGGFEAAAGSIGAAAYGHSSPASSGSGLKAPQGFGRASAEPRRRAPLPSPSDFAETSSLPALHATTLWGPTCDSFDKIDDSAVLPDMKQGDWLVYENMGAYTIAGSCKFNGFPLSSKIYVHPNGQIEVSNEEVHE